MCWIQTHKNTSIPKQPVVLESLSNAYDAEMHPAKMFLHGVLYAIIGMLLALWTFPTHASMLMIFFTSIAAIPLIYALIRYEEDKDMHERDEKILIKEHSKAVTAYLMLFLGITAGQILLYILLPSGQVLNGFEAQIAAYAEITNGNLVQGAATSGEYFFTIVLNNIRVLVLCILFSFAYGAGAIFILTWNASVIAVAAGNAIRTHTADALAAGGMNAVAGYLGVTSQVLILRYGIHGVLEIAGFIVAAFAGGIISVAAIKNHYQTKEFEHIVMDSVDLILIATLMIVTAAGIEAYITPAFYL